MTGMNWTSDAAGGIVFNIERFAVEDGSGIRTVVFLKGCGLRCLWCANPESQSFKREILFNPNLCTGCERCLAICPKQHIRRIDGMGYITVDQNCGDCEECVDGCFAGARTIMGTRYAPEELCAQLRKDKLYYEHSGGGVTFSGGEPLLQIDFIQSCADILKNDGIPILVETCGYVKLDAIQRCAGLADAIYFDVKHMDDEEHRKLTGEGNKRILDNLRWLSANYEGTLSVRYPYIPDRNTSETDIRRFLEFCGTLPRLKDVWFLPYHRLGSLKYTGLGRTYTMGDRPSLNSKDLAFLKQYAREYNLSIRIG